eukprot:Rmarinus@m.2132
MIRTAFLRFLIWCALVYSVYPTFAPPTPLPDVAVCLIIDQSLFVNGDTVNAFYDCGDDFLAVLDKSIRFNPLLFDYDLSIYGEVSDAASEALTDGCSVIIVDSTSTVAYDIATVAMSHSTLVIASSAAATSLTNTRRFPFFARVMPDDLSQGDCVTAFASMHVLPDVVLLYSEDTYGSSLFDILTKKLASADVLVLDAAILDGTADSLSAAVDVIAGSPTRSVIVAASAAASYGLFTVAESRNLTADGHLWLLSDAYVWYASGLDPSDPERQAMQYAVGVIHAKGDTVYASSLASYEAYTYDATMAALYAVQNTIAIEGDAAVDDVHALYRHLEKLWFVGRTHEVFFDESGNRQMAEFSVLSFGANTTTAVGSCIASQYLVENEVPLADNLTLARPDVRSLRFNYWKTLPTFGSAPGRRAFPLVGKSIEQSGMYLFGGYTREDIFGDLYFLSFVNTAWVKVVTSGNGPSPRHSGVLCAVEDIVIVYGGLDARGTILSDMHMLDMQENTHLWEKVEPRITPPTRRHFGTCAAKDGFFVFGGYSPYEPIEISNDLWEYSVSNQTWILHTPISTSVAVPSLARAGLAVSTTWDRVFVFGGTEDFNSDAGATYAFNLRAAEWSVVAQGGISAPGRADPAIAYYAGTLQVGLGYSYDGRDSLPSFFSLDVGPCGAMCAAGSCESTCGEAGTCRNASCGTWRKNEMRDWARDGMGLCPVFAGWMYCFGGFVSADCVNDLVRYRLYWDENSNATHVRGKTDTVISIGDWSYDIAAATVNLYSINNFCLYGGVDASGNLARAVANFDVTARDFDLWGLSSYAQMTKYHATVSFGGFLVGYGGRDQNGNIGNTLYKYYEGLPLRIIEPHGTWPSEREQHAMVIIGPDDLWMFGGATTVGEAYDTWKYTVSVERWTPLHSLGDRPRVESLPASVDGSFPVYNRGGAAVTIGDQVLYLGGEYWTGVPTNDIWIFSLKENTWHQSTTQLPQEMSFFVAGLLFFCCPNKAEGIITHRRPEDTYNPHIHRPAHATLFYYLHCGGTASPFVTLCAVKHSEKPF